jgi:hypothetical protein
VPPISETVQSVVAASSLSPSVQPSKVAMGVAVTGALVSQIDGPVPALPPLFVVPPLPPEPAPLVAAPASPEDPPVVPESTASSVVQPKSRLDARSAAPEIVFAEVVFLRCMVVSPCCSTRR